MDSPLLIENDPNVNVEEISLKGAGAPTMERKNWLFVKYNILCNKIFLLGLRDSNFLIKFNKSGSRVSDKPVGIVRPKSDLD